MADLTFNEQMLQNMVRHQVGLLRFSSKVRNDVWGLLDATESDLRAQINDRLRNDIGKPLTSARMKRVEATIAALAQTRVDAWEKVDAVWLEQMQSLALAEPSFVAGLMQSTFPVDLGLSLPDPSTLKSLVTTTPFMGATLGDWSKKIQQDDIDRIAQQIRIGMVQGESVKAISRRIVGTLELAGKDGKTAVTRRNAEAITRTATNSMAAESRREFYKANEDLLSGELFVATLDSRTTPFCRAHDGKVYAVGEGPVLPNHWGERSLYAPVVDGEVLGERPMRNFTEQGLLREYAEKRGLDKVPKTRDKLPHGTKGDFDEWRRKRVRELTGTAPAKLNYQDWLEGQSAQFQDDILGPTRGALFREGNLTLDKFVLQDGTELTLAELANRESAAFEAAGLDPLKFTAPPSTGSQGALSSIETYEEAIEKLRKAEISDTLESIQYWEDRLKIDKANAKFNLNQKNEYLQKLLSGELDDALAKANNLTRSSPVIAPPPKATKAKPAKPKAAPAASKKQAGVESSPSKMNGDELHAHIRREFAFEMEDIDLLAQEVDRLSAAYNRAVDAAGGNVTGVQATRALAAFTKANNVLFEKVMELRPKIHSLLKVDDGIAIKIRGQAGVRVADLTAEMTKNLKEAEQFLSSVTSKNMDKEFFKKPLTVKVRTYKGRYRANALTDRFEINLAMSDDDIVIVHEIGHLLEAGGYAPNRVPVRKVQEFLRERLAADPKGIRLLSKITGNKRYGADEIGFEDKFIHVYMGKVYGDVERGVDMSEVVSMGVEELYRNPVRFMRRDPDMFKFIVNLLRGTI